MGTASRRLLDVAAVALVLSAVVLCGRLFWTSVVSPWLAPPPVAVDNGGALVGGGHATGDEQASLQARYVPSGANQWGVTGDGPTLDEDAEEGSANTTDDEAAPTDPATGVPMWEVASEPDFVLGRVDGPDEHLFQVIGGVAQMSGGSLAVVDSGRSQIFFFSESGEFLRTAGRYGEGPGELQAHRLLQAREYDRLVLSSQLRISEAHEDGRIEPLLHGGLYGVRDWFRAVTPDGLVVHRLQNMGQRAQRSGPRTEDDLVLRYDLSQGDWVEARLSRHEHRGADEVSELRDTYMGMPRPDEMPVVASLVPDPDGSVWVELASAAPEFPGARWLALDEDWEVVGWLRLPDGFELSQVGPDFVLGTAFGPHGIGLVQRFELRRVAASGQQDDDPGGT